MKGSQKGWLAKVCRVSNQTPQRNVIKDKSQGIIAMIKIRIPILRRNVKYEAIIAIIWGIYQAIQFFCIILQLHPMMQTYLLNRCLNHHLGKARSIYNSYWERIGADPP